MYASLPPKDACSETELKSWITNRLAEGTSPSQITSDLVSNGWQSAEVTPTVYSTYNEVKKTPESRKAGSLSNITRRLSLGERPDLLVLTCW